VKNVKVDPSTTFEECSELVKFAGGTRSRDIFPA
jgi:hypothetical protein